MTKQEFTSKERAYLSISAKGAVVAVLSLIVVTFILMGGIALMLCVRTNVKNQWVSMTLILIVFSILIFLLGICYQLFIRSLMRKLLRLGLVCTNCGCAFFGPSAKIVLKTGKCGRCDKKVLDDIPDA